MAERLGGEEGGPEVEAEAMQGSVAGEIRGTTAAHSRLIEEHRMKRRSLSHMHGSRLDDEEEEEEEVLMDAGGVFLLELDEGHPDADAAEARQEARQRQTGERTQVRRGGGRTGAEEERAALARRFSAERQEVIELLRAHTCYDLIPASGKIIVLDTELVVKAALHALVENRIKSAPLWDSRRGDLVGMITVTDFIDVIRYFFHHKEERERVFKEEEYQISTWRSRAPPPSTCSG